MTRLPYNSIVQLTRMAVLVACCALVTSAKALAQPSIPRDLVRTQVDTADRPWLQLNTGGHTATVQALAFSPDGSRLYSAGQDKVVHIWNTSSAVRDLRRTYLLERTVRWQLGRALRGAIYALAVAPNDGLLAVGGYGASPQLGEIQLFEPGTGRLVKTLIGHRQAVNSLAFTQDGQRLVSLDLEGHARVWQRGEWNSTALVDRDETTYGPAQAATIASHPKLRPLAVTRAGDVDVALLGVFVGLAPDGTPLWKLRQQPLSNPQQNVTFDTLHTHPLGAIAATNNGRRWATADGAGNVFVWSPGEPPTVATLSAGKQVLSLGFTPDGQTLYAGTVADAAGQSELQSWDLTTNQLTARRALSNQVFACAVSADGRHVASSGGSQHEVVVGRRAEFPAAIALRGHTRPVTRVAFHKTNDYQLAIGTSHTGSTFNRYGPLERSFNLATRALSGERVTGEDDWLPITNPLGDWQVVRRADGRLQLHRQGQPGGVLNLDPRFDGVARCWCWITDDAGVPLAVAVGTDVQNSIYVFGLAAQGDCPVWRFYRGHQDTVSSLGVSRDRRYLASGSVDGTVRLWSLAEIADGLTTVSRWGATWAIDDGGVLRVGRVHPAGPLFFSGVRPGDVITRVESYVGNEWRKLDNPTAMRDRLAQAPFTTQVDFIVRRGERTLPPFPRLPAWQPLATLLISAHDEWALWTPEGYYDASTNGHTLFGWQVNRGLDRPPDFYRADQFRRRLERPEVLERLWEAGSVSEAFRLAARGEAPLGDAALRQQISATPRIDILAPLAGSVVNERSTQVRARIELPEHGELTETRVFASGVASRAPRIVEQQQLDNRRVVTLEWDAALPSEPQNLIQVLANTAEQAVGMASVVVEQPALEPVRKPRLHLLALGVNSYHDSEVQPLAYSVADANSVVQLFQSRAAGLFDVLPPLLLLNEHVTPANWQQTLAQLRRQLHDAQPDDLLVMFIAGHGFIDPRSGRYFLAGYEITREQFEQGDYASSIPWSEFLQLSDVPCRKLALVDTCHSGAVQPIGWRQLQSVVRSFQYDQVLTLTASAGHERSEENAAWQHGAFTKLLLDGLGGAADTRSPETRGDGVVTLPEIVSYVKRGVPELTAGRQNPTAGPVDLLPYISLRLSELDQGPHSR